MFKSKWIRIPVQILLIWLVITVYFYFQHPVIYRYTGLTAAFPIGDEQLIIDEMSIHNFDTDKSIGYNLNEKIPWQYQLLAKMNLSAGWNAYAYKVIAFYSRPPLTKDSGTMQIYGTYIFPGPISDTDYESLSDRYDISIYPTVGSSGNGCTQDFFKNALGISCHCKFPFAAMDKPLLLSVTDKATAKSTQLMITPQWQKERFIWNKAGGNPRVPVRNFISKLYQNKPQEALKYVSSDFKANSNLMNFESDLSGKDIQMEGNLKWIDIFEDYYGVYQVETEIRENTISETEDSFPSEKIMVYVHKNVDGKYEVINWQPCPNSSLIDAKNPANKERSNC